MNTVTSLGLVRRPLVANEVNGRGKRFGYFYKHKAYWYSKVQIQFRPVLIYERGMQSVQYSVHLCRNQWLMTVSQYENAHVGILRTSILWAEVEVQVEAEAEAEAEAEINASSRGWVGLGWVDDSAFRFFFFFLNLQNFLTAECAVNKG